jgi:type II secretory pathway component PulF
MYAHQIRNSNNLKPNSRLKKWEDVSHEEMSAFLGLWLSMGILRKPTLASYWYESQQTWLDNTPTFTKIIRRDNFAVFTCKQ